MDALAKRLPHGWQTILSSEFPSGTDIGDAEWETVLRLADRAVRAAALGMVHPLLLVAVLPLCWPGAIHGSLLGEYLLTAHKEHSSVVGAALRRRCRATVRRYLAQHLCHAAGLITAALCVMAVQAAGGDVGRVGVLVAFLALTVRGPGPAWRTRPARG
ncbi:hypothetical protein [Nonomuraea sp. NPDC049400]|uniref:hypothetical protein n=1 Tax=Nonomuraea sp. NPDC049400 TaxID=3364352 RepID=UPI0037BB643F